MAATDTQAAMHSISSSRPSPIPATQPAEAPPPAGAAVSQARYACQAGWVTLGAFSLPTVAAPWFKPFLSPRVHALRTLAAGMIYTDMIQPPMQVAFRPAPGRAQEALALTLGMMFYIPTFGLQAHLSNTWFADPSSPGGRTARASQQAWLAFCTRLPRRAAFHAAHYPVNFVLARVLAQMAAVGIGSTVAGAWQRHRGATLEALPQPARAPSLRQRVGANPQAYLACIAAFAGPTIMTLQLDRAIAAAGGRAPPGKVALLTTAVVAACIATGLVHPAAGAVDASAATI